MCSSTARRSFDCSFISVEAAVSHFLSFDPVFASELRVQHPGAQQINDQFARSAQAAAVARCEP